MKKFFLPLVLSLSLLLISCANDSDDDVNPIPNNNTDVTYSGNIKSIIDGNCIGCHSNPPQNSAPMSLTTYDNVKNAVQTRGLISQLESGAMPKDASKLSNASIQAIKDWQTGGFLE